MSIDSMKVCRSCRKPKSSESMYISLVAESTESISTEDSECGRLVPAKTMFEFVTSIKVNSGEPGPQEVCESCMDQLKAAYNFRKMCIESDLILRNRDSQKDDLLPEKSNTSSEPSEESNSKSMNEFRKEQDSYLFNYDQADYRILVNRFHYIELNFSALRCCGCTEAFPSEETLLEHCKQHQPTDVTQCPICFNRFADFDTLDEHLQKSGRTNLFCCRECYLLLDKKEALLSHLREKHGRSLEDLEKEMGETMDDSQDVMLADEQNSIAFGHSIFDAEPKVESNFRVSHVQSLADSPVMDTFALGFCEISSSLRLSHLRESQYRQVERGAGFTIIEFTWHRCCACTHMFATRQDLDIHCTEEHRKSSWNQMDLFGSSKPFVCEQCWKRFKRKSLLSLHQKFSRKKIYVCDGCLLIQFGRPAFEKHLPECSASLGGTAPAHSLSMNNVPQQINSGGQTFTIHDVEDNSNQDEEDDDDVYILDD
ncbi:zinc finger protein 850-like [Uranotaenia lowii]|uniref:zinc finger protein 850-like n=1 Tax=Uranotaenia lowii TaxID=190385 RepID=UPI0024790734|nr:zinc finger protein 850-like [Uranotaenia lowii]XP_055591725.1 zinc finger protein 850-like [Uranotaenia lowii]XP_055591726.1 zinc finger protein 850-like [Uranotaenia lowii]